MKPSVRTAAVGAVTLVLAACGSQDPLAEESGTPADATSRSETLVVASQQYYSNEIIAEIFAQALEGAGFDVTRDFQIGQREVYMPEMESGAIDVIPEYTGNLLQYFGGTADNDPQAVHRALAGVLPDGLNVLDAAEATDQDTYTTTQAFADEHQLTQIGNLRGIPDLKIAANSEMSTRPFGPEGLKNLYDVDATVVPVEDSGGPLTVKALVDGDVQLANIYSADPAIAQNGLVVLEDPEGLVPPNNVVPLVSERVDDDAAEAIEAVTAKLTAEELRALNARSVEEQEDAATIAKDWIAEQGLE